jgi:hypothetical protein
MKTKSTVATKTSRCDLFENDYAIRTFRISILIITTVWLVGCRSVNYVGHAAHNEPIPVGQSVVFGSILVKSKPLNNGLIIEIEAVSVIDVSNGKTAMGQLITDTFQPFCWCLPPGKYAILDLHDSKFVLGSTHTSSCRIFAQFSIDSEQKVFYVGKLNLASDSISVEDDYDNAIKNFTSKYSAINIKPEKQLLQLEKQR